MELGSSSAISGGGKTLTRVILTFGPIIVALLLIIMMIIPAQSWNQPAVDFVHKGFDSNLLYVSEAGYAGSRGIVTVTPDSLNITALPSSQPTVHLLTSTLSFNASMDIVIRKNENGTTPLILTIWSPRGASGFLWKFGPPPMNLVSVQTLIAASPGVTLVGGIPIQDTTLGQYSPNQLYHMEMSADKEKGVIEGRLSTVEGPPTGTPMLRIVGGPSRTGYYDIYSDAVSVEAGKSYNFGGLVKALPGSNAYKIALEWIDKNGNHLGFAGDWTSAGQVQGWTNREIAATAPLNATSARLWLGSGDNSTVSFAGLFFTTNSVNLSKNLVPNGDFTNGTHGWNLSGQSTPYVQLLNPYSVTWMASITAEQAPELLNSLRLTLTAYASSSSGIAIVVLQNYNLTLPHQTWQVIQISDSRATLLLGAFLVSGLLLVIVSTLTRVLKIPRSWYHVMVGRDFMVRFRSYFVLQKRILTVWLSMMAIFIVVNAYLLGLGSHPFDMTSMEIWAYTAVRYGPLSLYQLPNTVTLARVWSGTPYHEAIFPYEPLLAYISLAIGQLYQFLRGTAGFVIESGQLEILIKSFNVSFAFADGAVIYTLSRKLNLSQRQGVAASGLFLFNPAVLFSASIWGATQVISLFLILTSILFAEVRRPFWAWLTLVLTCLTRPQMLVPALLLGFIYLRKFRIKESIFAISWSIILVSLLISPFLLGIGPSFPKDVLANTLTVQEAGGNEPALNIVSLDAYSVWPLLTYLVSNQTGLSRMFYPDAAPLIGQVSYQQFSQLLTTGVILIASGLLLFHRKLRSSPVNYLLVLAMGTVGFLVFGTGLASTHYVIALPFLVIAKKSLRNAAYYLIIGIWTLTTLVPMSGSLGFALSNVSNLAPAIYQSPVTRFFMNLYSSDLFITFGTIANLGVFAWLALETWLLLRKQDRVTQSGS